MTVGGDAERLQVGILPRVDGAGSLSPQSTLRVLRGPDRGGFAVSCTSYQRVDGGRTVLGAWVPDTIACDARAQKIANRGAMPENAQDGPGYFLEITPTVEK